MENTQYDIRASKPRPGERIYMVGDLQYTRPPYWAIIRRVSGRKGHFHDGMTIGHHIHTLNINIERIKWALAQGYIKLEAPLIGERK